MAIRPTTYYRDLMLAKEREKEAERDRAERKAARQERLAMDIVSPFLQSGTKLAAEYTKEHFPGATQTRDIKGAQEERERTKFDYDLELAKKTEAERVQGLRAEAEALRRFQQGSATHPAGQQGRGGPPQSTATGPDPFPRRGPVDEGARQAHRPPAMPAGAQPQAGDSAIQSKARMQVAREAINEGKAAGLGGSEIRRKVETALSDEQAIARAAYKLSQDQRKRAFEEGESLARMYRKSEGRGKRRVTPAFQVKDERGTLTEGQQVFGPQPQAVVAGTERKRTGGSRKGTRRRDPRSISLNDFIKDKERETGKKYDALSSADKKAWKREWKVEVAEYETARKAPTIKISQAQIKIREEAQAQQLWLEWALVELKREAQRTAKDEQKTERYFKLQQLIANLQKNARDWASKRRPTTPTGRPPAEEPRVPVLSEVPPWKQDEVRDQNNKRLGSHPSSRWRRLVNNATRRGILLGDDDLARFIAAEMKRQKAGKK